LYLIDEIYDVTGPKELNLQETFTIRVVTTESTQSHLKKFVETYTICPSIHEIQIVWDINSTPPNPNSYFTYTKTHSKVNFETTTKDSTMLSPRISPFALNVSTEAILYLDIDTYISCEYLAFMYSVWRSSPNSVGIGAFPRFVTMNPTEPGEFLYYGAFNVWLHRKYSFLLSAALMQSKQIAIVSSLYYLVQYTIKYNATTTIGIS
jgi:hypothetical protein